MEEIIGGIAATLTTAGFIPQAIKVIKTRHTKDISLSMYVILNMGVAMWLVYGLMIDRLPIIMSNATTLIFSMTILIYKLKEEK